MKNFTFLVVLVLLAGCSKIVTKEGKTFFQVDPAPTSTGPVGCDPGHLGDLLDYAVYLGGDLRTDHVDISRRVAASYACFQHGQVGRALPNDPSRIDLASAGELGVNVSKILHGKATYGTTLTNVRSTALGGFDRASTDLHTNLRKLFEFSNACGGTPTNTTITRTCRNAATQVCTIKITGQAAGVNVAELSPLQVTDTTTYVIDIPAGSTLVTNLPHHRIALFRGVSVVFSTRAASSGHSVYWNFPSANAMEFTGTKFHGTVVAPDADITVSGQDGEAGFWAQNLSGTDSNW
jgi:choice-of-anchor A domain-containing protein